jgi:hypothetical protein
MAKIPHKLYRFLYIKRKSKLSKLLTKEDFVLMSVLQEAWGQPSKGRAFSNLDGTGNCPGRYANLQGFNDGRELIVFQLV